MLTKPLKGALMHRAPEEPTRGPAGPSTPSREYATLGRDAPIAWPTSARRVPVTGELSPHAVAALERMGIQVPKK